jgi:uncharacterized protein (DUF2147 family)
MRLRLLLPLLLISSLLMSQDNKEKLILGTWLNVKQTAHIRIEQVNNKIQGKIVWLKHPHDDKGQPLTDINNPDKKKRSHPVVGLYVLKGFTYSGNGKWEGGTIYSPELGKVYDCEISINDPNKLEVRGFIGVSLVGRTDIWTRVKSH